MDKRYTVAFLLALTLAISACGGSSGSGVTGEGKGYPGDTRYARNVIQPYFVNNDLVDSPVPPGTVLPPTISNLIELDSLPVANQGDVGTCAAVTFAELVYAANAATGSTNPLLDNVQYSYLFARLYESRTGGEKNYLADGGSYAYTNFRALTNPKYFASYTNGHLPRDGPKEDFPDVWTGIFYPPWHGPSIEADPTGYWNDLDLYENLRSGPTSFGLAVRTSGFTASSLDVKARLAAGNLVFFAMSTNDEKSQFSDLGSIGLTGVMQLPFIKPSKRKDLGGHAMVIVGYDDNGYGKYSGQGAFMVRNSWGTAWGDQSSEATKGYWYLPYALVDGESGSGASGDWPIYRDENYVYLSSISHN